MTSGPFILVTVGTTGFDPLVEAVDAVVKRFDATGLAQIGPGDYTPVNLPHERFVPSLAPWIAKADVVVSHGGGATTLEALEAGAALVSVANPDRYDNHQDDLLAELAARNNLVWCRSIEPDAVGDAIATALATELAPIDTVPCTVGSLIDAHLARPRPGRLARLRTRIDGAVRR